VAWCYTAAAGLVAYEPPADMTWRDGEDDESWRTRIGYQPTYEDGVGHEYLPGSFKTYIASDEAATYRYLILMNAPRDHIEEIWIPTFADWLGFLAYYGPGITGYAIGSGIEDLHALLEKLFQAWHGHSAMDLCHACDPHGYARQMERRRQARAKG
jgi:hypothetical protein